MRYLEWSPPPALSRYIACSWTGGLERPGEQRGPILPDCCIDIIYDGSRLFVAGPDTSPVASDHDGPFTVGIRFRPGMAPVFLGLPASDITDERVDLADLWDGAGRLADELAEAPSLRAGASILEAAVLGRLAGAPEPDVLVEETVGSHATRSEGPPR